LQRLESIQSLRGLAALGVLLCHAGLLPLGAAGVDLFFVISGFVIASIAPGREPGQFALDRFWRIFPLYWLASLPWLAVAYVRDLDTPWRTLTHLTLMPFEGIPYLRPGWSLLYEVLFYGAALFILLTGRWRLLAALFLALLLWGYVSPGPVSNYLGYPLTLNFIMGAAIARARPVSQVLGAWLLLAGAVSLALTPDMSGGSIATGDHQTYLRALVWGVPCAMIVWGASSSTGKWPLQKIGDASYSLYLVHMAPAILLPAWAGVPLALALGMAVHFWIEKPILASKPRLGWRPRSTEAASGRWDQSPRGGRRV
jgi:exopolysaccharide production protein ExoZ